MDYYILVQGYNSLVGTFTLEVTCTEPTVDAVLHTLGDPCLDLDEVDTVLIERQVPRNHAMGRIQHYIEMFFVGVRDRPVTLVSAREKLRWVCTTSPWWDRAAPPPATYAQRKRAVVDVATRWLADPQTSCSDQALAAWDAARKKDDLADALVQALYFSSK